MVKGHSTRKGKVFTFAARGLDIPGIRTVIHYQLPHSADVYIHRSGLTARASSHGCSIALISPKDKAKFISLCKSMEKETLRQFPLEESYLPEVMKRMSLACQLDKISRKNMQENVKKNWFKRSAESLELTLEESGSEEETVNAYKQKRAKSVQLKNLQQNYRSQIQFALALLLKKHSDIPIGDIEIRNSDLTVADKKAMSDMGCKVLDLDLKNIWRRVEKPTFFFIYMANCMEMASIFEANSLKLKMRWRYDLS